LKRFKINPKADGYVKVHSWPAGVHVTFGGINRWFLPLIDTKISENAGFCIKSFMKGILRYLGRER
jgi:hypothetical protein